jgi:hypothetical protein
VAGPPQAAPGPSNLAPSIAANPAAVTEGQGNVAPPIPTPPVGGQPLMPLVPHLTREQYQQIMVNGTPEQKVQATNIVQQQGQLQTRSIGDAGSWVSRPGGVPVWQPNVKIDHMEVGGVKVPVQLIGQPNGSFAQHPMEGNAGTGTSLTELQAANVKQEAAKSQAKEEGSQAAKYGDLIKPPATPIPGPGGTEPLPTDHNTQIPPVSSQSGLPKSPAEADARVASWQKTTDGWYGSIQPSIQAQQRLESATNAFKAINTGAGTEQRGKVNAYLKSMGLPEIFTGANASDVEIAIHDNIAETLNQLKATQPRFAQSEFKILSQNKEHPNLQPEANLQMLSEDIAQLKQARDLAQDWGIAQDHGWRNPQAFESSWTNANPISGYVDRTKKEIGPLKGMEQPKMPNAPTITQNGHTYQRQPDGSYKGIK